MGFPIMGSNVICSCPGVETPWLCQASTLPYLGHAEDKTGYFPAYIPWWGRWGRKLWSTSNAQLGRTFLQGPSPLPIWKDMKKHPLLEEPIIPPSLRDIDLIPCPAWGDSDPHFKIMSWPDSTRGSVNLYSDEVKGISVSFYNKSRFLTRSSC